MAMSEAKLCSTRSRQKPAEWIIKKWGVGYWVKNGRHPPDVGGVMGLLQETGLIARETRVRY